MVRRNEMLAHEKKITIASSSKKKRKSLERHMDNADQSRVESSRETKRKDSVSRKIRKRDSLRNSDDFSVSSESASVNDEFWRGSESGYHSFESMKFSKDRVAAELSKERVRLILLVQQ